MRGPALPAPAFAVLVAGLMSLAAVSALAAPMNGDIVTIRQADGSFIDLAVWGDEFYAVGETPDGYTVVRDDVTGVYCYAKVSADGNKLVSTGIPAAIGQVPAGLSKHVRVDREAASAKAREVRQAFEARELQDLSVLPEPPGRSRGTSTGSVTGLTLIVDFSDDVGTIPPSSIDDFCNLEGYTGYSNNGSVRDYFDDVSGGLLDYTNYVSTAYYRAANPKSYYTDPSVSYGTRAVQLIKEALNALDAAGFDFSAYDADGNGSIDALNCFYAGATWNNWAEGLWPHSGWMSWCADGVCTQRYQISNLGSSLRLGTFVHENGHMLMGWPDLYDYDGDSAGVGQFCVMCSVGPGTNPIEPCAYMKYTAGWADLSMPTGYENGLSAPSAGNVVYKFDKPGAPNEYYLVENRQKTGRDSAIPDNGLAIWHVDENGSNDWQQRTPDYHYEVTLVQADGDWDLEHYNNNGDSYDLYAATAETECTPTTYPNTDWWDGSESGYYFTNISSSSSVMTFDFADGPPFNPEFTAPVFACEIEKSGSATYLTTIRNPGSLSGNADVDIEQEILPDGVTDTDWTATYRQVGGPWLSTPSSFYLGPGEEIDMEVRFEDGMGTMEGMCLTTLTATVSSDPTLSNKGSFATFVDMPCVAIIDDDNGAANETYLATALEDAGYCARVWDASSRGRPSIEELSSYSAVFWTTAGGDASYLSADDEQNLMDYLDGGGDLFMSSMGYLTARTAPNAFTQDYLHLDSWQDDVVAFSAAGVAGDQISDGMSLMLLAGPVSSSGSDAMVLDTPAEAIFSASSNVTGLKVAEGDHKIVFLSFAFENVKTATEDPNNQRTLVSRVMDWFMNTTGVDDLTIGRLALGHNYPNPFNPTTNIAFSVPDGTEPVALRVYSVDGRLVRTLVDGAVPAGPHTVLWDGTNDAGVSVASGVYFARLSSAGETKQTKMALLK